MILSVLNVFESDVDIEGDFFLLKCLDFDLGKRELFLFFVF